MLDDDGKDKKNGPTKLERYINQAKKTLLVKNILPYWALDGMWTFDIQNHLHKLNAPSLA
jgi:hypothetical protein